MAKPIAKTGGDQTFAYSALPKQVTLDGGASYDPDGAAILSYSWRTIDVPPGSSAQLDDATKEKPKFTADKAGTYLFLLVVTSDDGGVSASLYQEPTADIPTTAWARVTVTTQHRSLKKPAQFERGWGNRLNEALDALDTLAGAYDTHTHPDTESIQQTGHGFSVLEAVKVGGTGKYVYAQADAPENADADGIVVGVPDADNFEVLALQGGRAGSLPGSPGLTIGAIYYLSASTPGGVTQTPPSKYGEVIKPLFRAFKSDAIRLLNYVGREVE